MKILIKFGIEKIKNNMLKIFHNPRCKISRVTLNLIEEKGVDVEVIDYLNNPPTREEMKDLLNKLNMKPIEILRKQEDVYKQNFKGKEYSDEEWIKILVENPKLIA